ncbi:ribosomal protein L27 [Rickenella mellea]|uniref:Large ribosomal subunit protein bL27m n=1 Tax=Rickenella mellea TaxID=50990 RepID=A0A4Y7QIE2_9AGAM|nr:ribosomal protein L27 [Rickenella mellea]
MFAEALRHSAAFYPAYRPFLLSGLGSVRNATKRAGGTVRNDGHSPGKRLGVKKFSDEYVIPGNIIVRQRGTQFHPGQHVGIGRDHTLFALVPGYVRFYTEERMNGKRGYVGIVLNRGEKLPRDEAALGRSRYFGLVDLNAASSNRPNEVMNP